MTADEPWRVTITLRRGARLVDARRVELVVATRTFRAHRLRRGRYRVSAVVSTPGVWPYSVRVGGRRVLDGRVAAHPPRLLGGFDVVVESSGDLLVADASNRILRIRPDRTLSVARRLRLPTEVAPDPGGGYAAISDLRTVVHFSANGARTVMGRFEELGGIAFGGDGTLYASEVGGRILRVDVETRVVTPVVTGLRRPHGLVMHDRELLVAEADAGRILSVDLRSGTTATRVAGLGLPIDLASAPDGTLYIADYGNGQLVRSGLSGTSVLAAVPRINGVAVGGDGAVYTTERDVGRVARVDPETGLVTTFVGDS